MLFSLFSSALLNHGGLSKSRWDLYMQFSFSYLFSSAPLDHGGLSRSRWDFACTTVFLFMQWQWLTAALWPLWKQELYISDLFITCHCMSDLLNDCVCTCACCISCVESVSLCHDQCPSVAQNQNMSIFLQTILTGRKRKGWCFKNKFDCLRLV